jgi:uncharacterized protein (DUF1778 family)
LRRYRNGRLGIDLVLSVCRRVSSLRWVAAALRQIVQSYNSDESNSGGLVQRIGARASNVVLNANAIRLLVAAAQPLMKSLDQEQKQHALVLARHMGFGGVAGHFE